MKFRPCIDIHNGKVKQIVGGSLCDREDQAVTNFASELSAAWYARLYKKDKLKGGHIILLNSSSSPFYEETRRQAMEALAAYPEGMQIGGGITDENAAQYLRAGASHVIVTSYVFQDGMFHEQRLKRLVAAVGKQHLVLDLSCRRRGDKYYVVTERWQNFTDFCLTAEGMKKLASYCDEFLIHGVDVEGKSAGVEQELVRLLAAWQEIPITYAGGIGSLEDLQQFQKTSQSKLDITIGSALDLFGGPIAYETVALLGKEGER